MDGSPASATGTGQPVRRKEDLRLLTGGIRAGGEGGTTPALAVVVNAIVDALAELGVTHIEMPATPERVWRAIREAAPAR
jgi:hypothetical protein